MSDTIGAVLAAGERALVRSGIADGRADSRRLLQHLLGLDHAAILSGAGDVISSSAVASHSELVARRIQGEPVARIIGTREFFGLPFKLNASVLDPRPDTELLVERVLADLADKDAPLCFADIGTGSGAIAIALLVQLTRASAIACDISADALAMAGENARSLGVASRFSAVVSDYFAAVERRFDFITANPPYISSADLAGLQREVRLHDPQIALDGGADGLDAYRAIVSQAAQHIVRRGRLYLELGAGQHGAVGAIGEAAGWKIAGLHRDLAGLARVLVLEWTD